MEKAGAFKFIATFAVVSILGSTFTALPASATTGDRVFTMNKGLDSGITMGDTQYPSLEVTFEDDSLDHSSHSYRQVVFDEFNGQKRKVDVCYISSGTCDIWTDSLKDSNNIVEPGVHRYTAYLDKSNNYWGFDVEYEDINTVDDLENHIATSNTLPWVKESNSFSLSGNSSFFSNDWTNPSDEEYSQLDLHFSDNPLTQDYAYFVFDTTNDEIIGTEWYLDGSNQTIFSVPTDKNNDQITYQAFFASSQNWENVKTVSDLVDIRESSNTVVKTRRPWVLEPLIEGWNSGVDINYIAGGGDKTVYLEDKTTGEILWSSQGDQVSSDEAGNNGHSEGDISWARAFIADPWDEENESLPTHSSQLTGIIAKSDGLKDTVSIPGVQDREQMAGGSNPSEICPQTCVGDPINVYTGEFFDNKTDLSMAGKGFTPSVNRHFSTQKKNELNLMGYGWRNSYEMSVKSATGEPLSTASRVKVVQENGSASFFDRQQDGTFTAQNSVQATLAYSTSTGWSFVRNKRDTFAFNTSGKLTSVKDIHGNTLNVSYANSRIATVADSVGNILTFHYNTAGLVSKISTNTGRQSTYTYQNKNLISVTDENGIPTSYTYDTSRRVKTLTDALGGITENFYNSDNRVVRQDNPLDQRLTFSYENSDGMNQETTITYADGSVTRERYFSGLLVEKRENENTDAPRVWRYSYDKSNNLVSTVAPDGSSDSSFYDNDGNKVRHINAAGGESTFTYDSLDNVLTAKNPLGHTVTNTYDAKGNLLSTVTPEGHKTTLQWNSDGTLKSTVDPRGNKSGATAANYKTVLTYTGKGLSDSTTSALGNTSKVSYDSLGRAISSTLPKGTATTATDDYVISSSYNALDLPTVVTDQKGNATSFTYDNVGNILSTTDELGNVTISTYDLLGRLETVTTEDGTSSVTYDMGGRVLTNTDSLGKSTTNVYNEWGDLEKVIDPMNNETSFTYDKMGRVLTATDPTGAKTQTVYDTSGRAIITIDALGEMAISSYNNSHQVVSSTDKEGRITTYSYDKDGDLATTENPDGTSVSQSHDSMGNLVSRIDGEGSIEKWAYDAENRTVSYTNAEGETEAYGYDANSNLITTTRVDGSIVATSYDSTDLPTTMDYPGAASDLSYTYDNLNRIIGESKNGLTMETTYDHAGRIASRGTTGNVVSYAYDANGQQTSVIYPSNREVSYGYDDNGNMVSAETIGMGTATFEYDTRGVLSSSTLPNGVVETRATDAHGQTTEIDIANSTQQLHKVTKGYTPSGNIESSNYGITGNANRVEETYTHDAMNRTIGAASTLPGSTGQNTYNKAGHMTKLEGANITLDSTGKPLTVGTKTLGYDPLGNRTEELTNGSTPPQKSLTWSTSGLLEEVVVSTDSSVTDIGYGYTADGLLSDRTLGTDERGFIWDSTATNALMLTDGDYEYIYGPSRVPMAQIDIANADVEYLHADANGSVIAATSQDGFLVGITNYGAYGKPHGSAISRFGFAGEWTDPDTGYVFLRARWYDPATGNFLSKDPIVQITTESYGYAGGNPLARIDPSGLFWEKPKSFLTDTFTKVVDFGKDTVQSAKEGDWVQVASNVGTAAAVVGTVAAVGAVVIGTGGLGAAALVSISTAATATGIATGAVTSFHACSQEGFSKNCQWELAKTATGAIPFAGGNLQKVMHGEAMARKTIKQLTFSNRYKREYKRKTGRNLSAMPRRSFTAMKRRNNLMVGGYLASNTAGLSTLLVSEIDKSKSLTASTTQEATECN